MANRWSLALASMAVALFAANAQAALEAHWTLDENPITPDVTTAADATGNWDGVYKDASFFGEGDPLSVTGHTGLPNTAVRFGKNQFVVIDTPRDPNDPTHFGGIAAPLGDFMIEYWFQLHPGGGIEFSENLQGASGPVLILGGGTTTVQFRALRWTDSVVDITPPDGLDIDQWYYIAGTYVPPEFDLDANGDPMLDVNGDPIVAKLGSNQVYLYDGTTIYSDSSTRQYLYKSLFAPPNDYIDRVRFPGNFAGFPAGDATYDEVKVFDQAFDPQSFLVQVLGIPEPASLAVLVLGGLLLTRRRRGA